MTCFSVCFGEKVASSSSKQTIEVHEEVSGVKNIKLLSYKELQIATENFSTANKVGEGGFGFVYKGMLKDGTLVAIKVLSASSRQGVREFLTEIDVIKDIEHENLVKLYGCCVEGTHRILVYGYLENNSLAQTLLGGGNRGIQFTWSTRCKICIGVAQGLAFLHEEVQPHIVHRDIKASNILLDTDFTPKISDFGLAKFFPNNLTHVSTRVAGTEGYLAPEYALRGQLTRKADIYSFGVLLLEIVSGRPNINMRLRADEQYLLERAWELYKRGLLVELLDISMSRDTNVEEEACRYMKIGLLCTQEVTKLRPSMSTVVKMLTGEINVDAEEVSEPGTLLEFMGLKAVGGKKNKLNTESAGSGGKNSSSSSSGNMTTSHATMTFNSIYDRSS